ncbi:hypothetical protein SAMN04488595_101256 [Ralstonia sp. 25mfcol4.1]|nr:hypothetical protein SAMN04488595_101256 [Ralstonia sp. 25mfcol4.1]
MQRQCVRGRCDNLPDERPANWPEELPGDSHARYSIEHFLHQVEAERAEAESARVPEALTNPVFVE